MASFTSSGSKNMVREREGNGEERRGGEERRRGEEERRGGEERRRGMGEFMIGYCYYYCCDWLCSTSMIGW